jgi:PadR family transcriptional regulator, regulatory protein PadR
MVGEFELLVLLAVMRAGDEAYGSVILGELQQRAGRDISRGALYVTLDRLEAKGLLSSRAGSASPARGGRPRRYYTVRRAGLASINESLDALARMRAGLKLGVKPS